MRRPSHRDRSQEPVSGPEDLALEDPAWEDPAWEDPAWEDPAWEDPAWEDPAWEDPAWEDPVPVDRALEDPVPVTWWSGSRRTALCERRRRCAGPTLKSRIVTQTTNRVVAPPEMHRVIGISLLARTPRNPTRQPSGCRPRVGALVLESRYSSRNLGKGPSSRLSILAQ